MKVLGLTESLVRKALPCFVRVYTSLSHHSVTVPGKGYLGVAKIRIEVMTTFRHHPEEYKRSQAP
jgi:hypothetical protein